LPYRAIPTPIRQFSRVVRVVALVDVALATIVAIPVTSSALIRYIYRIDAWLGIGTSAPDLRPSLALPINVAGMLALWSAIQRLVNHNPASTRLDVWRRVAIAAVILYYVLLRDQTPVLLFFVVTEMAAAVAHGVATRRFARRTGG
jgi:hypothetical protein